MNNWIELTKEEKESFKKSMERPDIDIRLCFNLQSDKNDLPSSFREMSKEDVVKSAQESAAWLMGNL